MFKVGQLVQSKTNPTQKMIILSFNEDKVTCVWTDNNGVEVESTFSIMLLESADIKYNEGKFSPDERLFS